VRNTRVVDCAGGYGILVRLLRDFGIDALWSDPYCKNLVAVGFEHNGEAASLVTAFEVLEHFVSPSAEIARLFEIAPNILFSTELIADPAPKVTDWWYYGANHGQHIGFFRERTLVYLARKFNKHLCTDSHGRHLFSEKPVSKFVWKKNFMIERIFPGFFSRKLKSRIWSDYQHMSSSE
ncbi:class I SAM-dependent methyltransferase, partial [Nostoc sp. CHAB 5844]|nr:class I SAM-dependent methyltransferase [Nostoc sp. CHAB 5844]